MPMMIFSEGMPVSMLKGAKFCEVDSHRLIFPCSPSSSNVGVASGVHGLWTMSGRGMIELPASKHSSSSTGVGGYDAESDDEARECEGEVIEGERTGTSISLTVQRRVGVDVAADMGVAQSGGEREHRPSGHSVSDYMYAF